MTLVVVAAASLQRSKLWAGPMTSEGGWLKTSAWWSIGRERGAGGGGGRSYGCLRWSCRRRMGWRGGAGGGVGRGVTDFFFALSI